MVSVSIWLACQKLQNIATHAVTEKKPVAKLNLFEKETFYWQGRGSLYTVVVTRGVMLQTKIISSTKFLDISFHIAHTKVLRRRLQI